VCHGHVQPRGRGGGDHGQPTRPRAVGWVSHRHSDSLQLHPEWRLASSCRAVLIPRLAGCSRDAVRSYYLGTVNREIQQQHGGQVVKSGYSPVPWAMNETLETHVCSAVPLQHVILTMERRFSRTMPMERLTQRARHSLSQGV
jgi:hypothetical protein